MQDFRRLQVWQRAHTLTLRVYAATRNFPREEIYGLSSQMRRASVSVTSNIAEGAGRSGRPEFARFLEVSFGSASELEYYLLLAYDLKLLARPQFEPVAAELAQIKRMLAGLIRTIRRLHRESQSGHPRARDRTGNRELTTEN